MAKIRTVADLRKRALASPGQFKASSRTTSGVRKGDPRRTASATSLIKGFARGADTDRINRSGSAGFAPTGVLGSRIAQEQRAQSRTVEGLKAAQGQSQQFSGRNTFGVDPNATMARNQIVASAGKRTALQDRINVLQAQRASIGADTPDSQKISRELSALRDKNLFQQEQQKAVEDAKKGALEAGTGTDTGMKQAPTQRPDSITPTTEDPIKDISPTVEDSEPFAFEGFEGLNAKSKLIAFQDFLASKKTVSTQDKIDLQALVDAAAMEQAGVTGEEPEPFDPTDTKAKIDAAKAKALESFKSGQELEREFLEQEDEEAVDEAIDDLSRSLEAQGISPNGTFFQTEVAKLKRDLIQTTSRRKEVDRIAALRYEVDLESKGADQLAQINKEMAKITSDRKTAQDKAINDARDFILDNNIDPKGAYATYMASLKASGVTKKTNQFLSEQLGFLSDDYGQPTIRDGFGNGVKFVDQTRWSMYQKTDPYTQQTTTFFYDPMNPGRRFGDDIPKYQADITGADIEGFDSSKLQQIGNSSTKNAGECVFYAREKTGLPFTGGDGIEFKRKTVEKYGSTDMNGVKVGDCILTDEGTYGHAAVVVAVEGDTLFLDEANFYKDEDKKGIITVGRPIKKDSSHMIGYVPNMKGAAGEGTNFRIPEGVTQPVVETVETQNPTSGFKWSLSEHDKFSRNGGTPQFKGRSQQEKDAQEAAFRRENQDYLSLKSEGQVTLRDYNPGEYRKQMKDLNSNPHTRATQAFYELQGALKEYSDIVKENRGVEFFNPVVNNKYAALQIKWKEAARLGAITGPDLGLMENAIPAINTLGAVVRNIAHAGFAEEAILEAISNESLTISGYAQRNVQTLNNMYPDLRQEDLMQQLDGEARANINNMTESEEATLERAKEITKGVNLDSNEVVMMNPETGGLEAVSGDDINKRLADKYTIIR
uniref:Peptidase C51 domain-containing protein n=1 Tax=uncultured marine virus TaxID=186617 RepID=A0A0F7L4I8_9VIRU|nr:hypothetical protein [uncultured marine virus]